MQNETEKTEILPHDDLLRRIQFLDPNFIKEDGTPASSSFTLKKQENGSLEDGLSVDIARLTTFEKSIEDISRFRLFALKAGFVTELGLFCEHDPLPDNFAHTLIKGNINRKMARKLAQNAVRISYPE
jgi:hypothetical protein